MCDSRAKSLMPPIRSIVSVVALVASRLAPIATSAVSRNQRGMRAGRAMLARRAAAPRPRSVPVETGDAVAVERGVAEGDLRGPRPLEVESHVVLVGHADPAVHLHALVAHQHERVRAARLGGARQATHPLVVGALVERAVRGEDDRAHELQLDEHARGAMLEGLEAADRDTELL